MSSELSELANMALRNILQSVRRDYNLGTLDAFARGLYRGLYRGQVIVITTYMDPDEYWAVAVDNELRFLERRSWGLQ